MNQFFNKVIVPIYRFIFVNKLMYPLNKILFNLSLRGLGILNYENEKISGEKWFIENLFFNIKDNKITIFDVGANIGRYSDRIKTIYQNSNLYSFEPHPLSYAKLKILSEDKKFNAFNLGCGDMEENVKLFDYSDQDGSEHASTYRDVIETIYKQNIIEHDVNLITIDRFCETNGIKEINLLKIDTEGNELKVLKGAKKMLAKNLIDVIHFEFNEMNVFSNVFFKNFLDLLPNYTFYRLMPNFLIKVNYSPLFYELFAFQNIIAVRKGIHLPIFKNFV